MVRGYADQLLDALPRDVFLTLSGLDDAVMHPACGPHRDAAVKPGFPDLAFFSFLAFFFLSWHSSRLLNRITASFFDFFYKRTDRRT